MRPQQHTYWIGLAGAMLLGSGSVVSADPPLIESGSRSIHTGREATGQGFQPFDLAAADFDGDGDLDVLAGAYGGRDIVVLLNGGDGSLAREDRHGTEGQVTFVLAADFDGDGRPDVAAKIVTPGPLTGGVNILFGAARACRADFNGDGLTNTQDALAFLNAWAAQDGRADFNDDGLINTQDVLAFLNAWTAGCP